MTDAEGGIAKAPLTSEQELAKSKLIQAGHEAFDAEDFEKALDCYHRASLLDNSDPVVWNCLGLTYTNLDFHREAWRSYKLALKSDPENLDAVWYGGEFLFNVRDYALARLFLTRYLELETDEQKTEEAQELLDQVKAELGEDDIKNEVPISADPDDELADVETELPEGFEVEDEELSTDEFDEEDDEWESNDEYGDSFDEEDEEMFTASLHLQLTGMSAKCQNCGTSIPADAPYCFNCKAPHFYED
jgi:tetratricopeptide (TPR) repeat protein